MKPKDKQVNDQRDSKADRDRIRQRAAANKAAKRSLKEASVNKEAKA